MKRALVPAVCLLLIVSLSPLEARSVTKQECTITGTSGSDTLRGTGKNDVICGLGGRDRLIGFAGYDTLIGGAGDDVLRPGPGLDTVIGGNGADTVSYVYSDEPVIVHLRYGNSSGEGPERIVGVENIEGSRFSDRLDGGVGPNRLEGKGGADKITGRKGVDVLSGGRGGDVLKGGEGGDRLRAGKGIDTCDPGPGGGRMYFCEKPPPPCPENPLRGVYHPQRLDVLGKCRWYRGIVTSIRDEEDGDSHVNVKPAPGYGSFLNSGNKTDQHGALVTEIMPGQKLPVPDVGDSVWVYGTWVFDTQHGWNEIHPIWSITYDNGLRRVVLPPVPPLYDPDEEGEDDGSGGGGGGDCTPGYKPCIPKGADVDCAGGGGNGPRYVDGPVYVTGSDPYNLDADGDGVACED